MKKVSTKARLAKAREEAARIATAGARIGIEVSNAQALELAAAVHGHDNWHVYRALLLRATAPQETRKGPTVEPLWTVFTVALYAGSSFIAKECVLATDASGAEAAMHEKHWDVRIDDTLAHYVTTMDFTYYREPSLAEIESWLLDAGKESEDLDELVHEASQRYSNNTLNAAESPHEEERYITDAESAASTINNEGMFSQLEYLRPGSNWLEFVRWIRRELEVTTWPELAN